MNKQIGWRFSPEIISNYVKACKKQDKDPQAAMERFMKEYGKTKDEITREFIKENNYVRVEKISNYSFDKHGIDETQAMRTVIYCSEQAAKAIDEYKMFWGFGFYGGDTPEEVEMYENNKKAWEEFKREFEGEYFFSPFQDERRGYIFYK